jgi:ABC-type sugar transport system substrate-binding protein
VGDDEQVKRAAIALLFLASSAHATGRFHVTFISIGEPAPFWDVFSAATTAAAEDLDVDLEILNAHGDHLRMIEMAREVASRPSKPDYLLVNGEKGTGGRLIEVAAAAGLKTLLIMSTFDDADAQKYGKPREKLPTFLGTLRPDNERAGHDLARALMAAAHAKFPSPLLRLLAISGVKATRPAADRDRGLRRALADTPEVALAQLVHSDWNRDKARRQMMGLLRRWPDTRVVWAANDPMALGTMDAAQARGLVPGRDLLIGGLNWSIPALQLVRSGELVASAGGHFLGGAWALVLLRDYHDGIDFAHDGLEVVFPMGIIDHSNVDDYLRHFGDQRWDKIDFRRFSRSLNPKLKSYEFTLQKVLEQFARTASRAKKAAR